jgi:hypothetical protein
VFAAKLYPAGATTNSEFGVTDVSKIYSVLQVCDIIKYFQSVDEYLLMLHVSKSCRVLEVCDMIGCSFILYVKFIMLFLFEIKNVMLSKFALMLSDVCYIEWLLSRTYLISYLIVLHFTYLILR